MHLKNLQDADTTLKGEAKASNAENDTEAVSPFKTTCAVPFEQPFPKTVAVSV